MNKTSRGKARLARFALAASIGLAVAFTVSCSGGGGDNGDGGGTKNWCVYFDLQKCYPAGSSPCACPDVGYFYSLPGCPSKWDRDRRIIREPLENPEDRPNFEGSPLHNSLVDLGLGNVFDGPNALGWLPVPESWYKEPDIIKREYPWSVGMVFMPSTVGSTVERDCGAVNPKDITFHAKASIHTNSGSLVVDRELPPLKCDDEIFRRGVPGVGPTCKDNNTALYVAWNLRDAKNRWIGAGAYVGTFDFYWTVNNCKEPGRTVTYDKTEKKEIDIFVEQWYDPDSPGPYEICPIPSPYRSSSSSSILLSSSSATPQSSSSLAPSSSGVAPSSSSNAGPLVPLACNGLPASWYTNQPITQSTLVCGNGETAANVSWIGSTINWTAPAIGTYNIGVMADCGSETGLMTNCGNLNVFPTLSCEMPSTAAVGIAIAPPVAICSDNSKPSNVVFEGILPNWDNPALGNYVVNVKADCGAGILSVSCGNLSVIPPCTASDNTSTHYCSEGVLKEYGSVKDSRDDKSYKTVVTGTQTWMAENLNYNASGSKCNGDLDSNCEIYGRLYDWATAKIVCPSGWHLPTQAEWNTLSSYVQSDNGCSNCDAKLLKATSGWINSGNGTNDYGFSALPGGYGYSGGSFYNVGYRSYWWSSNENGATYAYYRDMYYVDEYASWYDDDKSYLFSVRCVKD